MKLPAISLSAFLATSASIASPRFESDDLQARHDLLLMRDSGALQSPVLTWPWPVGRTGFGEPDIESLQYGDSRDRLVEAYREAEQLGVRPTEVSVAFASQDLPFRSFGYQPREEFETSVAVSWLGEWTAGRVQLGFANDPSDGDDVRLDGSYFGVAAGNWMVAVDQVQRWWGPGWEGNLLLSNSARPFPAVSLTRLSPDPFETKWLSWIGPWTFTTFMGQLDNDEGDRPGSDARLFGMRIDFSPTDWLDIGLNRAAQWAGEGRPGGLDTFWKLLVSEDNVVPGSNVTEANEPGNQLAGFDYRLKLPRINLAHYGQVTGEDEDDYQPDANMILYGLEIWGELESMKATWRAYYEFADTRAGYLLAEPRDRTFNIAYNHGIYREGYRYKGQPIGHAMDGDGRMKSIGFFLVPESGNLWGAKIRSYELNRDGRGPNSVTIDHVNGKSVELFGELKIEDQKLKIFGDDELSLRFGIHYAQEENQRTGEDDDQLGGYLAILKRL